MYTKLKHEPSREVGKARRRLLILRRIDRRAWNRAHLDDVLSGRGPLSFSTKFSPVCLSVPSAEP